MKETDQSKEFTFGKALKALSGRELGLILIGLSLYLIMLLVIDHRLYKPVLSNFIVLFSLIKILYILFFTFRRLTICLSGCHSFYNILTAYGIIIGVLVISFATDYFCLQNCLPEAFLETSNTLSVAERAFNFLYFSLVTFATIGYGDIVPMILKAKLLVMFEITTSFVMIVFVISNFDKIPNYKAAN